MSKFYKPSKPVPTLNRSAVPEGNAMGDRAPAGHHRYMPDRWTGSLDLLLKARTPLLLLDGFSREIDKKNEHQTVDTRSHLLRTQLKGVLRSAYEMITNSRLGCVEPYTKPLKYRSPRKQEKQSYNAAPAKIFEIKQINPASCLEELSPAERVFGWVNPEGKGAYKGQLRVSRLELVHRPEADEPSAPKTKIARTLAPLASPKPAYVRFYGAMNLDATPFQRWDKAMGYTEIAGDAGRNDYFTHPDKPEGYFGADVTPGKKFEHGGRIYYPEYLADEKNNQNMTVRGEVPAGTRFAACIQFHNLSGAELGALLWLLTLEEGAYYSLGSGKPFGFGSIEISLNCIKVWSGSALKTRYESLLKPASTEEAAPDTQDLKQEFEKSLKDAYGDKKSQRLLRIFKEHRKGPPNDFPVHYPRREEKPGVEHGFEWFQDSEKPTARWSLGDAWDSFALPYRPVKPKPKR